MVLVRLQVGPVLWCEIFRGFGPAGEPAALPRCPLPHSTALHAMLAGTGASYLTGQERRILELIAAYQPPDKPFSEVTPRPGAGHGVSEAPRRVLYHRYQLDADGTVLGARRAADVAEPGRDPGRPSHFLTLHVDRA
jgi:hypothetical protein